MSTIAPALERAGRRPPGPVVVAIGVAWAVAVVASVTGAAEAFHHDALIETGPPLWVAVLLFVGAWQVMVVAMMLPSSLPLIRLFGLVSRQQEGGARARAAFLGGYAAVWTGFGALAFLGDVVVHRVVHAVPPLAERPSLIAGGALAVSGAFQFSGLKDQCLSKCRRPGPYLLARYRRGPAAGFKLGLEHGLYCLGCCWALMLVMFAAGVAVLWWMAALTAVMVVEKTARRGATLTPIVGVLLLAFAVLTFAQPA